MNKGVVQIDEEKKDSSKFELDLYIDDLCVDEKQRGKHIGSKLYQEVLALARQNHCYNVTLNVWSLNEAAIQFYQSCGLKPQKIGMEVVL